MRGIYTRCLSLLSSRRIFGQQTLINNTHSLIQREHYSSCRYHGNGKPKILLAGLLGLLGFGDRKPEEDDPITSTIKSAILCIQRGDVVKADKLLHVALQQAQVSHHEEAVTHIYCLMANLALERGLLNQAEKLFTNVLQRLLSAGEAEDSNAVLEISLKIARIFQAKGENKKAEQGFNYCVSKQRTKLGDLSSDEDSLALLGMSLDWMAQFYLSISNLTKAESVWREALEVAKKIHGDEGEQVLVVTNSLATVISMQQGRELEAGILLEDLVRKAGQINSGLLTTFLVNLGLVRLKQGLFDVARSKCEGARRIAETAGDQEVAKEAENCLEQVEAVMAASVHNK